MSTVDAGSRLLGRRSECAALDELVASVRAGASRALVLRGEAGVGKSALLAYLARRSSGCAVARATGVESEMELAFAGLQQLCAPFADRLERLPAPQRDALGTAFGLRDGDTPDRFLVGLAVLSLMSAVAETQALVCIVDDAQWLDGTTAQALAFVARRLGAEALGLVFAVREPSAEQALEGLPELVVEGLDDADARELLGAAVTGPMDEHVRERLLAEAHGNPLALLELPLGRTPADLAGGYEQGEPPALARRIEQRYQERLAALPPPTRLLVLVAAAEPVGDPVLVWRAAATLGIGADAEGPATAAGLVDFGAQVRFRHPLVRSAAYLAAEPD
jgi:AAA ATPase domain